MIDLKEKLELHEQWLGKEGEEGELLNLEGANLSRVDLSWANLEGANLEGANLKGADLEEIEEMPDLMSRIAEIILSDSKKLNMGDWHTCDTTHCIAGWITTLHPQGKHLEGKLGTSTAACLIIKNPDITNRFHDDDDSVLQWLGERWSG